VAKSYRNNRRLTTVSMTPAGGAAFTDYLALLEQIVREAKPR
jgi:Winged helix DNA-binding domain